jgi:hypothetical protein
MTKALNNPNVDISKHKNTIALSFGGNKTLVFDRDIKAGRGNLYGVDIIPLNETVQIALDYPSLHAQLGHPNDQVVQATAKHLGIEYRGSPTLCEACAQSKIRIKNIPKETTHKLATHPGGRIMFDISSVQAISHAGNKFWLLIMDEFTGYCWSYFLRFKSDLVYEMVEWIKRFQREHNHLVKFIRCDNAGENHKLLHEVKRELTHCPKFEFTAPNTPQQNGRVERKFATLYGKVRSMLNAAKFPQTLRHALWAHAV